MNVKIREKLKGKEMKMFIYASAFLLYVATFLLATPTEILQGMKTIIWSKDALITDYFKLAGYGAAFFNAGLVLTIGTALVNFARLPFTGIEHKRNVKKSKNRKV